MLTALKGKKMRCRLYLSIHLWYVIKINATVMENHDAFLQIAPWKTINMFHMDI